MNLWRRLKRPGWRGALLGLACALGVWVACRAPLLRNFEEWLQDGCFAFRGQRHPRARVLVVGLDDKSLAKLRKPLVHISPDLAKAVKYLSDKKAAAIGLDLMIPQDYQGLPELDKDGAGDATLLGAVINEAGIVVLPEWRLEEGWMRPVIQWQLKHLTKHGEHDFGFVNFTEDADLFLRRQQLFFDDTQTHERRFHFALALVAQANGWKIRSTDDGLFLDHERVPLDDEDRLRINFFGPPGTFKTIPFHTVLEAARTGSPLADDPRGAIVIIGVTARSQQDFHTTPYSNTYWSGLYGTRADLMSGTEIHANIAATLLDRAYITVPPWPAQLGLLLVAGVLMGRAYARMNLAGGLLLAVGHHFGWKFLCLALFAWVSVRLEILPMLLLGACLYAATFLQRWWTLRRMVGVVKSESVARLLENDPGSLDQQGEDRVVTVLFADIRDFTTFSENHAARDVVALLNAYFSVVVPIVERHGGNLNQYMGDGIMVIFGAPEALEDQALRAVRAAVDMIRQVTEQRARWAALGCEKLRIGVGVHTGRAVLGMVGSSRRLDYTAIGDTINTAARIESKTRDLDADILISRSTYLDLPRDQRAALGCESAARTVQVKGRTEKVEVYPVRVGPPQAASLPTQAVGSEPTSGRNERSTQPRPGLPEEETAGKPEIVPGTQTITYQRAGAPRPADGLSRIGPYRLLSELGRGGMGIVYRAEDQRLQRIVALKVLRAELAADPTAKARFLREARSAAAVEHDHVIPIYEADQTPDGTVYLAMPCLRGETLQAYLEKAGPRLPLKEALRIAAEVASGLAAAHVRGLIHRDVKPANIWLESSSQQTTPGRVRLLDFGLARVPGLSELTTAGAVVGTPAYMSPEQARGEELDARSDLFSLGTVLFRLVSGQLPFTGDRPATVLRALEDKPAPRAADLRPDISPELDQLLGELLAKRPEERPPSAKEVHDRLRTLLTS